MNVFKRIHDIFSSNVNHALDKLEDPAKMIRYTIVEMENSLSKAKDSAAKTLADSATARNSSIFPINAILKTVSARPSLFPARRSG